MALHDPQLLSHRSYSVEQMVYRTPALALTRWGNWTMQTFLFIVFTLTSVANMTLHDPRLFAWFGYPVNEIYGGPALAAPRWLNSAFQTGLFAVMAIRTLIPLLIGKRHEQAEAPS